MEPLAQIKASVEQVGKNFEEFKLTAEKARKDGDVLLDEKLKKIGDDITAKLEAHQKELDRLAAQRGHPAVLRCDNGPELACAAMADWAGTRVGLCFIPPGEPLLTG